MQSALAKHTLKKGFYLENFKEVLNRLIYRNLPFGQEPIWAGLLWVNNRISKLFFQNYFFKSMVLQQDEYLKVLDIITVVILKQQNTSPILTATFVVVMELDWKSYVRLNVVYATVSMIVGKPADIRILITSYSICSANDSTCSNHR